MNFKLWLEWEHLEDEWDSENEFANIRVELSDGRNYGLNVWTYNGLKRIVKEDEKSGENLNGLYQTPPDLLVKELTRECIEKIIFDLLTQGNLEEVLNQSIIAE